MMMTMMMMTTMTMNGVAELPFGGTKVFDHRGKSAHVIPRATDYRQGRRRATMLIHEPS